VSPAPAEPLPDAKELLALLTQLHSAAILWRDAAYNRCPTLVVSNEAVNMLSAALLMSGKAIAKHRAVPS
jgi:hypothetical protein